MFVKKNSASYKRTCGHLFCNDCEPFKNQGESVCLACGELTSLEKIEINKNN